MDGLLRLLPEPQPLIVRYGLTIVLVLLMFSLKLGLRSGTGLYGFILYVPAVVAAALLFDRGSGYFAVAFSSALVASTLPWSAERSADHVSALSSFILISSGLVLISEGLRRALERAEAAKIANQILLQEMSHRKELLTREELESQLREHGVESFSEVRAARLEGDGRLSVFKMSG